MQLGIRRAAALALPRAQALGLPLPLVITFTVALAFVVRGRRALTLVDFPLNDGGMFYSTIEDIRHAAYALPQTLSYNLANIPFAYPPLGFYLSAIIRDALGVSTSDVLRVLPIVFSTLIVVAYVPLARALSRSPTAAAVAVFAAATQPSAYTWMVMGGGLTRSLGIVFAVAALVAVHHYYTLGGRRALFAGAVLGALTLLSHLEMAWFLAFSGAVFLIFYARDRVRALIGSLAMAAIALAITAPWWLLVLARHGAGPFVAAATTGSLGNPIVDLIEFRRTDEPYFPLIAAVGLLGLVACVARRRWDLPAWLLAIALLDQRSFNALSALPLGLLAGVAVTEVIVPLARDRRVLAGLGVAAVLYATFGALRADQDLHRALTRDERAAMIWLGENSAPEAKVIVVSDRFWAGDRVAEWLPALSGRRSVDTVQGTEWLPKARGFWGTLEGYDQAQKCASQTPGCLLGWANAFERFDYVYLPKSLGDLMSDGTPAYCCVPLRLSLRTDPAFKLVYDGPGATIYEMIGGG